VRLCPKTAGEEISSIPHGDDSEPVADSTTAAEAAQFDKRSGTVYRGWVKIKMACKKAGVDNRRHR
jgi:hypothetical protein